MKCFNDSVCRHFPLSSTPTKHKFQLLELFPYRGERFGRHILSSTLQNLLLLATEQFSTNLRNLSPAYGKGHS